jgi:hypothetical protein
MDLNVRGSPFTPTTYLSQEALSRTADRNFPALYGTRKSSFQVKCRTASGSLYCKVVSSIHLWGG